MARETVRLWRSRAILAQAAKNLPCLRGGLVGYFA